MDRIHVFFIDEDNRWIEDVKRILILDPSIRLVGWAASSTDTWSKLQQIGIAPDIFVVHSVIADGSSFSLIQQLKQQYPSAVILMQTAQPDASLYPKAMQLGISQIIIKQSTASAEMMNILRKAAESIAKTGNANSPFGNYQQNNTQQQPNGFPGQSSSPPTFPQPSPAPFPPSSPAPFPPNSQPFQQPNQPTQQPQSPIPFSPPVSPQPNFPMQQPSPWSTPASPQSPAPASPQPIPNQQPWAPQPQQPYPTSPQQPYSPQPQQPWGQPSESWGSQPSTPFGIPNMPTRPTGNPNAMPTTPLGVAPRIKQTMIALHSPKGGVGKSTLSKEIAAAFATVKIPNTRPGEDRLSVCLVDLNLDYGDISSMLRVRPVPNISTWGHDVLNRIKRRNDSGDKKTIQYTPEEFMPFLNRHEETGLFVLTAPPRPSQGLFLVENLEIIGIILDSLKNYFDVLIVDTGNNINDYTITVLEKAQKVLLVSSTDVTCVEKCHALLDTLKQLRVPLDKFGLVINQVPKRRDVSPEQVAQVIHLPLFGYVVDDPRFRDSNNTGQPLILSETGESVQQLFRIAHQIIPAFGNKKLNKSTKNSWLDWFKRS